MNAKNVPTPEPIAGFSNCHAGILSRFERLRRLPQLLADPADLPAARQFADGMVRFVRDAVFEHHAEEEQALFPAVARSAAAGDERQLVDSLVARLTREHRELEALWAGLEPAMKNLARGKTVEIDAKAVDRLCRAYGEHAHFEETVWLPLSERILKPNDMAALGLTLHLRHALDKVVAHI
ncbi:hemerythrin domain-containing protein [Burkholderiaceae bacterium FT117]|uniref:hemerythrin domain-containing protein n=1 Tax=Zeimonas sediminis TaxID=2944268 RepID=UPI002342DA52|nr:hemerythrin domain-containing protein [Zeimonas sediminis]MCM5570639.1 hemerythrin domain-containing protein [Zeimonas sediminis]